MIYRSIDENWEVSKDTLPTPKTIITVEMPKTVGDRLMNDPKFRENLIKELVKEGFPVESITEVKK